MNNNRMYEINIGLDDVDAATAERVYNAIHDVLADVPQYWRMKSYAVLRDRETKLYYHADDRRWATVGRYWNATERT